MGPRRAAEKYLKRYPHARAFSVTLYGSLAATGKGHLTDAAIIETLGADRTTIVLNLNIGQFNVMPRTFLN